MDPMETARAPRTPRLQRGGASFAASPDERTLPGACVRGDALARIVETVRERGLATIRLSVIPQNEQALEFYRRDDFAETGEIPGGEIVMERQL